MNSLHHTNGCRRLLTILRNICFIASAVLLGMSCRSAAAQAEQPSRPPTTAEPRQASPSDPLGLQSPEKLAKQLLQLKDRLVQLSQGEQNETTKVEIESIVNAIGQVSARAQALQSTEKKPDLAVQAQHLKQLQEQFALQQKLLAERDKQYASILTEQRRAPLPPLDNGTLKIYHLLYSNARDGALTVESLFGTQSLRVAVDERSNSLLIYGKPDVMTTIDAVLTRLDEQASPNRSEKKTTGRPSPRSLMLRVFWLADSVPETVGQNPADFLPKSVLEATRKLGLESPRLVTQTVNSLATGNDDSVDFSSSVPALLLDEPVGLSCEGKLKWVADDRVRLDMAVHVGSGQVDLRGSMATPLGHYMVLGTANSMIAEGNPMAGGMVGAPGMGMGPGMGPGGGRFRQPGGEFAGPEGGAALPAGRSAPGAAGPGGEFGGPGGMEAAPQAKQKYATSRFAFVIQVTEGQSYGAEKVKAEGE